MTQKFKWVHDKDSIAKALTLFDDSTDVLLVISNDNTYSGILTERMILRSGLPRKETKVDRLKSYAPKVKLSASVQQCARLMLENDLPLVVKYNVASLGDIKLCLAPVPES